jgi:hypothetical protein
VVGAAGSPRGHRDCGRFAVVVVVVAAEQQLMRVRAYERIVDQRVWVA